jgi:hypothetical protein
MPGPERVLRIVGAAAIVGGPLGYLLGGLLGVVGWAPFSALAALDDLASVMSRQPGRSAYAGLLDGFTNDSVMGSYLIVYVVCHLVAYVLLGIALRRARLGTPAPWQPARSAQHGLPEWQKVSFKRFRNGVARVNSR